ncbi:MAG: Holliday junction branch migration protein RuvA [Acidobacteriota bacterium]
MIARLKGLLAEKHSNRVIVDVQGVGYEVFIPFSTYYELGEVGESVSLRIYTHVKEDALSLYGFLTSREKTLFAQLIQLSGIGPRLGITILSGLPVEEFVQSIMRGDVARLNSIPGVGKKTAERILLEMRDKVASVFPDTAERAEEGISGSLQKDVVSALVNLGYAKNVAEKAIAQASREQPSGRFEDLLRLSLRKIS